MKSLRSCMLYALNERSLDSFESVKHVEAVGLERYTNDVGLKSMTEMPRAFSVL